MPFAEIPAEERELAEDLIFARRPDALQRLHRALRGPRRRSRAPAAPTRWPSMTSGERLHYRIVHRKKEGIEADIDQAVSDAGDPVEVLNNVLLPAMKEVGDKFGAGELILPFVLQSAEAMKKAVAHLETYLERQEGVTKGTVVLATVYRRRPRHRQEPGQHHPDQQRLHRPRPRQAGAGQQDHRQGGRGRTPPRSGSRRCWSRTSKQMPLCVKELHHAGLAVPGHHRRRGDQPPYAQRTLFVDEETPVRTGRLLRQGRLRGSVADGPHHRSRTSATDSGRHTVDGRAAGAATSRAARPSASPTKPATPQGKTVREVEPPAAAVLGRAAR